MSRSAVAPLREVDDAAAAAIEAARQSGVDIVALDQIDQLTDGAALLATIWGADDEGAVVSKDVLRAMAHSGNYVAGAYLGTRLVGMSVGFLGMHEGDTHLHSHISGVARDVQNRRIGFALKQHQRAWSLRRGLDLVVWTFDPLVRRNASFNLARLGAEVTAFHPNFYGHMEDTVNAGDESDRAVVEWALLSSAAVRAATRVAGPSNTADPTGDIVLRDRGDGRPEVCEGHGRRLAAWVPPDIVELRRVDSALALDWRRALRSTFGRAVEDGYVATNMTKTGWYELERRKEGRT
ncbi:MAG: GNAT family N-acetyltransferase [Actinobacteria bacterium]|nr:GNAT family N-acetyltransferase [Actinomycetota bacterium]